MRLQVYEASMTETDVEQAILAFLRERFGVELPSASANLIETGILDSMMFVDLIVLIEERFGVVAELDDLEIDEFRHGRAHGAVRGGAQRPRRRRQGRGAAEAARQALRSAPGRTP